MVDDLQKTTFRYELIPHLACITLDDFAGLEMVSDLTGYMLSRACLLLSPCLPQWAINMLKPLASVSAALMAQQIKMPRNVVPSKLRSEHSFSLTFNLFCVEIFELCCSFSHTPTVTPIHPAMDKEQDQANAREAGWVEQTKFDYGAYQASGGRDGEWFGESKRYEWKEEYGDVGPPVPELERTLFAGTNNEQGEYFKNLEFKVTVEGPMKIEPVRKVSDADPRCPLNSTDIHISSRIWAFTLWYSVTSNSVASARQRRSSATPSRLSSGAPMWWLSRRLVSLAWYHSLSRGSADISLGSGKTVAYMVPVMSKLMGKVKKLAAPRPNTTDPTYNPKIHKTRAEPLVIVVVPTRELAIQIFDDARRLCYRSMMRPCVAYGGFPMSLMLEQLGAGCDILIATPGRLCDLMARPDVLSMNRVK